MPIPLPTALKPSTFTAIPELTKLVPALPARLKDLEAAAAAADLHLSHTLTALHKAILAAAAAVKEASNKSSKLPAAATPLRNAGAALTPFQSQIDKAIATLKAQDDLRAREEQTLQHFRATLHKPGASAHIAVDHAKEFLKNATAMSQKIRNIAGKAKSVALANPPAVRDLGRQAQAQLDQLRALSESARQNNNALITNPDFAAALKALEKPPHFQSPNVKAELAATLKSSVAADIPACKKASIDAYTAIGPLVQAATKAYEEISALTRTA
jgi:hypothetical protein